MFLKLKNINFSYKNFKILKKINFKFEKTWIYTITWPSWSWKSTLLKIIWWFLKPESWEIFFEWENIYNNFYKKNQLFPFWKVGIKVNKLINFKQKNIGFSYQNLNLIDELSVKDNLELKSKLTKIKIDNSWKKYLLEYFEISDLLEKKVGEISWWQALRVSLIKSVLLKPKILLLDEPESWLDSRLTKKLIEFEKDYAKNNLVIISSHYLNKWKKNFLEINKI